MKIDGFGGLDPLKKTHDNKRIEGENKPVGEKAADASDSKDAVEISYEARLMQKVRRLPEVRAEKIMRIKEEIKNGTYITQEKLNQALDRLLEDLQ